VNMIAPPPTHNGQQPTEVLFTSSNVRKLLRQMRGEKLTAREITEKLGCDAGPMLEPSGAMMNIIRILAQLKERGEVMNEMPTAARPEIAYWIDPPREKCPVCGERECTRHG